MNHLLAKTKGREGIYFKVISDKKIFEKPNDLDNPKEYNPDYKLEDDEWFSINNFSQKAYFNEFLNRSFISTEYNQIPIGDYDKIDHLCAYQNGIYYFQKLSASQVIRKKYFFASTTPTLAENEPIIVIDTFPDAIYIKIEDILYFKKLNSITTIFIGIDELYKEATQEETESFLENDFIKLGDNYSADKVKSTNRKRIALAVETLKKYSLKEKKKIFVYILEYCDDLHFDKKLKNFLISNEEELKKLLYGIEQRYYTTRLGGERRLANSIITLSHS